METPDYADDIPLLSNRAMFFNKLENYRKRQKGFWLLFRECCGQCGGRGFVENILTDVTAVRLEPESEEDHADILLERGDKPSLWLIFTQPSPLSVQKLAYCMAHGIDVFELDGGNRPVESSVIKAHIAPRNCRDRKRRRLADIWDSLRHSEFARIGIREDMRSDARKQREWEQRFAEMEADRDAVARGEIRCSRCNGELTRPEGNGYSFSYHSIHRPDGLCGMVPLCDPCSFAIMGGLDGVRTDDAGMWFPQAECPTCAAIEAEEMSDFYAAPRRESLEMPASFGIRLVQEPEKRVQQYEVADRTVNREELLSVVMMLRWCIELVRDTHPENRLPRTLWMLSRELDDVVNAVMFTNNIVDWNWRDGVGDSYISDAEARGYDRGDRWSTEDVHGRDTPVPASGHLRVAASLRFSSHAGWSGDPDERRASLLA